MSLQHYLRSNLGCCIDYAYLLKSLLDHEGIENRLTCIPGHCFNEACLGGRWRVLDASINICLDRSWDELYESARCADSVRVLIFPHACLRENDSGRYRSLAGQFRLLMLTRIANRPPSLRAAADHLILPTYFD